MLITKVCCTYCFYFQGSGICGWVVRVVDLESLVPPHCGFECLLGTVDTFMWGRYLASLRNVRGSTELPVCAWNVAGRGTLSLSPPVKLESHHITFTLLVWQNPSQNILSRLSSCDTLSLTVNEICVQNTKRFNYFHGIKTCIDNRLQKKKSAILCHRKYQHAWWWIRILGWITSISMERFKFRSL